jgi:hypothetical protein
MGTRATTQAAGNGCQCEHADLAEVVATWIRITSRKIVHDAPGLTPAGFRPIATTQERIASDAEVDLIEAFMTAHPEP